MASSRSRKSVVWEYFLKTDEMKAGCKECRKTIPHCGNTTNLLLHLKHNHPLIHSAVIRQKQEEKLFLEEELPNASNFFEGAAAASEPMELSQSSRMTSSTDSNATVEANDDVIIVKTSRPSTSKQQQPSVQAYVLNASHRKRIDNALAYFIVADMEPYSIVDHKGFNHFLKVIQPGYSPPSRKTMTEKVIPDLYCKTREVISSRLEDAQYMAFTTDCWTSAANKPFISLTCHFIRDWQLESICLHCYELQEDHTGENLADTLTDCLAEWNIHSQKVSCFTTDCGSNIVKCFKLLEFIRLSCFGHAINNGVDSAFRLVDIENILDKIKKIQSTFAHSWKLQRDLKEAQTRLNYPQKKMPSFSKTRWWSILRLIEFVVEQNLPLSTLLGEFDRGKYRHFIVSLDEVDTMKSIVSILKPINEITDMMAGEKYVTASTILPVMKEIEARLREIDTDETQLDVSLNVIKVHFMQTILDYLQKRYEEEEKSNLFLKKCKILDPRFKSSSADEYTTELKESILSEMATLNLEVVAPEIKRKKGLSAILKKTTATRPESENKGDEYEVDRYLLSPNPDPDDDALQWWKNNKKLYPKLAILAKKYLCAQATSVASERVFSKGGLVITDRRVCLSGEHAEQLIFLSLNQSIVPK